MINIKIYTAMDGHAISFSGASNIYNDVNHLEFDVGSKNKHYVFYKANMMGFCIEEMKKEEKK